MNSPKALKIKIFRGFGHFLLNKSIFVMVLKLQNIKTMTGFRLLI